MGTPGGTDVLAFWGGIPPPVRRGWGDGLSPVEGGEGGGFEISARGEGGGGGGAVMRPP